MLRRMLAAQCARRLSKILLLIGVAFLPQVRCALANDGDWRNIRRQIEEIKTDEHSENAGVSIVTSSALHDLERQLQQLGSSESEAERRRKDWQLPISAS